MARRPAPAFASVLEQLRTARGLSPADLARALHVSPTQVSRWRRGQDVPSISNLEDIARLFGVDRETLERLAGYRANPVTGEQDTIDPQVAAMLDNEKAELQEILHEIDPVFWNAILQAQRTARKLAVDNIHAMQSIFHRGPLISSANAQGLAPPPAEPGENNQGGTSARPEQLPPCLEFALAS